MRDNIHSFDLVNAFEQFAAAPRPGEVYNMGGSRFSNCSMMEAIVLCEEISGNKKHTDYIETNCIGDHVWRISDVRKFASHYPAWRLTKTGRDILADIREYNLHRWKAEAGA